MYLGGSFPDGKKEVISMIKEKLNLNDKILDVGAGCGTYGMCLGVGYNIDAIEIYLPTANYLNINFKNALQIYNEIYTCDIINFKYTKQYDLVIFGDVLEHLSVKDAQKVLKEAENHSKMILIAVPYELSQEAISENQHEIHLQNDLTDELFNKRYPGYTRIWSRYNSELNKDIYGYYFKIKD